MSRVAAVLIIIVCLLSLVACGHGNPDKGANKVAQLSHDYDQVQVPYQGGFITCIRWWHGHDSDGVGGISCDFDAFYGLNTRKNENG